MGAPAPFLKTKLTLPVHQVPSFYSFASWADYMFRSSCSCSPALDAARAERSVDYRFFPERDLSPLAVTEEMVNTLRGLLPELPQVRPSLLRPLPLGVLVMVGCILTPETLLACYTMVDQLAPL
jgi:hypothetical protein